MCCGSVVLTVEIVCLPSVSALMADIPAVRRGIPRDCVLVCDWLTDSARSADAQSEAVVKLSFISNRLITAMFVHVECDKWVFVHLINGFL